MKINWWGIFVVPAMLLLGGDVTTQQRKPDFAGTWTLVEFRIGDEPAAKESPVVGGAPVTCGSECTVTQTPESLTVSRAPAKEGAKPQAEVVHLDDRTMSRNITVKWNGDQLVLVPIGVKAIPTVDDSFASIVVTQTLSLEKKRLKVVVEVASARTGPYVLTYERK